MNDQVDIQLSLPNYVVFIQYIHGNANCYITYCSYTANMGNPGSWSVWDFFFSRYYFYEKLWIEYTMYNAHVRKM